MNKLSHPARSMMSFGLSFLMLILSLMPAAVFASGADVSLKAIHTSTPYAISLTPGITDYTLYVPYVYSEGDFASFAVPKIEAVTNDIHASVQVSYPDDITGDIVIVVTGADGLTSETYTLDLVTVGNNLYTNGGFEDGITGWLKTSAVTLTAETNDVYAGRGAMRIERPAYGYYLNTPLPKLSADKKYLHSTAIKLANDETAFESGTSIFFDGDLKTAAIERYDENGPVQAFGKVTKSWNRHFETIVPSAPSEVKAFYTAWTGEPTIIIDDMYVGELVVSDVVYNGETDLKIPFDDGAKNEYTLSASLVNQFGFSQGLEGESLAYSLCDEYEGVALTDNVLEISDLATVGEIKLDITANPAFNTDYGSVKKTVRLKLDADWESKTLPRAKNLKMTGVVTEGNTLSIHYDFYQAEGKAQGASLIQWYYAESENESYYEIPGATELDFTVDSFCETKFIKASVIPVDEDGTQGEVHFTQALLKPQAPQARDVFIEGDSFVDEIWEGKYTFFDINGDEEALEGEEGAVTTYRWLSSDSPNGSFKPIENANTKQYTVTAADIDQYIVFEVTPKTTVEPTGSSSFLSAPKLAAAKAAATDVKIKKLNSETYSVSYKVSHPVEGVFEKDSIIKWYIDSRPIGEGAIISTSGQRGDRLTVEVIPRINKKPYEGTSAYAVYDISEAKTVASTKGNRGNKGGSSFVPPSATPPGTAAPTAAPNAPSGDTHWAAEAVKFNREKNIMPGLTDGMPVYDKPLTRQQFVVYVMKAIGETEAEYKGIFTDMQDNTCCRGWIQRAFDLGILSPDDNFYPSRLLTREEASKIVALALGFSESAWDNLDKFSDKAAISDWAKPYVAIVEKEGILKGISETEFNAGGTVSLGQSAVITKRLYERKAGGVQ